MKPLLFIITLLVVTLTTGCEATRSFKDGSALSVKLSPDPAAQKEAVDRGADALRGFRK